MDKLTSKYSSS